MIYTAHQAEDIVGINNISHGPTDYVVAKGKEVLKAANYKKPIDPQIRLRCPEVEGKA